MFRLLLLLLLSGVLSACTLTGKRKLDAPSLGGNQELALIFQSNDKFAPFLTSSEKLKVKEVELQALNFGKPSEPFDWAAEPTTSGTVVAFQLFRVGTEQCRKFKHTVTNSKETDTSQATACLRSNGKWQLVR